MATCRKGGAVRPGTEPLGLGAAHLEIDLGCGAGPNTVHVPTTWKRGGGLAWTLE